MGKIYSVSVEAEKTKEITVYCNDVTAFHEQIDILTTSAFIGSYAPTPRTVFAALYNAGIYVHELAMKPQMDLRKPCHIWLSEKILPSNTQIERIGCVEFRGYHSTNRFEAEHEIIRSIRAYFSMLDIALLYGIKMDTIALPLLGSGAQHISPEFMLVPLINECISFLKRNAGVQRIYFIERNEIKANLIANHLKNSLRFIEKETPEKMTSQKISQKSAFISYSSNDKNIADNLCAKLEGNGIKVWYAPRDVSGPYAESIVRAIDNSSLFIVILSQNSIASEHVLNEIDLAFQNVPDKIKIKPLRIDDSLFTPSFKYYLSRQHWMDATVPPLEERLNEFVASLLNKNESQK